VTMKFLTGNPTEDNRKLASGAVPETGR
jgi:hypothetical protein